MKRMPLSTYHATHSVASHPMLLQRQSTLQFIIDKLQKNGYAITAQRLRIIKAVPCFQQIKDPEELWITLHNDQKISLATVYSTLNMLCSTNIIRRKTKQSEKAEYALNL